jgi:hypothetical protein
MAYFAADAKHELNALMLSSLFGYIMTNSLAMRCINISMPCVHYERHQW